MLTYLPTAYDSAALARSAAAMKRERIAMWHGYAAAWRRMADNYPHSPNAEARRRIADVFEAEANHMEMRFAGGPA